jgi:hypothetical protein
MVAGQALDRAKAAVAAADLRFVVEAFGALAALGAACPAMTAAVTAFLQVRHQVALPLCTLDPLHGCTCARDYMCTVTHLRNCD